MHVLVLLFIFIPDSNVLLLISDESVEPPQQNKRKEKVAAKNVPPKNVPPSSQHDAETETETKVIPTPRIDLTQLKHPWEFRTAFRLVDWKHWPFGESNIDNGKALVDAGHVQNVKEVDKPGSLPVITGICIPQTNIREPPYKLFMEIDLDRKVTKLECGCRDGVICKHGFGLIHYMNTQRDETKTDVSCGFNEPSKGSLILDIFFYFGSNVKKKSPTKIAYFFLLRS